MQYTERNISELKIHPLNRQVYGNEVDPDLVASLKEKGQLVPVTVTSDNMVISGHSRILALQQLGIDKVSTVSVDFEDENAIKEAIIHSNRQRKKNREQLAREYRVLSEIEEERTRRQIQENLTREQLMNSETENQSQEQDSEQEIEKRIKESRKLASQKMGMNQRSADKASLVVDAIDRLMTSGKEEEAGKLRKTLNKVSVNKALDDAVQQGAIEKPQIETLEIDSPVARKKRTIMIPLNPERAAMVIKREFSPEQVEELKSLL